MWTNRPSQPTESDFKEREACKIENLEGTSHGASAWENNILDKPFCVKNHPMIIFN